MLQTAATDDLSAANLAAGGGLRTLIHMDDPLHRDIRKIGADWFRPKAMRALKTRVDELAKIYVDKMVANGPECDFVQEVAVNFPLYVILSLLGLPESDFGRMLKLTQEMFGGDDDELTRGKSPQELHEVITDFFRYFTALTAERRAHPTEDLASAIANAKLGGDYLDDIDCLSYYVIVASAGARHHQRRHLRRPAGPDREPGPARAAEGATGADGHRGRGDDPLDHPGQGVHAHRHRRHRGARGGADQGR